MPWHPVTLPNPLASGENAEVEIERKGILVCRIDSEYFAVSSRCTHSAWPLSRGPIEGTEIVCSLHGARFNLRDGCPTLGPAVRPLVTFPIELRNGELYVSL